MCGGGGGGGAGAGERGGSSTVGAALAGLDERGSEQGVDVDKRGNGWKKKTNLNVRT